MSSQRCVNRLVYQRGAIGLVGTVTLLLAVMFTGLAVDTGRLWMQQRQLQLIADNASMDAARQLGCNIDLSNLTALAQASAVRNGYTDNLGSLPNTVELGNVTTSAGIRQFAANTGGTAVRVFATREVPASLVAGGLLGSRVRLRAQAVSQSASTNATFAAGTTAASIDTADSALLNGLLGNLLGTSLSLDVLSYRGLASTQVTLLNLVRANGSVGSVNELLNQTMPLTELLGLVSTALGAAGNVDPGVIATVEQLASGATGNNIRLADVLTVTTGDAAANARINVLSLITASALVANGTNPIPLAVGVSVPPIASVNATITMTEGPSLPVGGPPGGCASLTTGRLRVQVTASAAILTLNLQADVARGTAVLQTITDDGSEATVTIDATPGIATVVGTATATVLGAPINIGINLPIQAPTPQQLVFTVPHPTVNNLPQTQSVSTPLGASLGNALGQPNVLTIPALGPLISGLLAPILNTILSPLLTQIGNLVLDPLLDILGIQLGGMDVILMDVQLGQAKPLVI